VIPANKSKTENNLCLLRYKYVLLHRLFNGMVLLHKCMLRYQISLYYMMANEKTN